MDDLEERCREFAVQVIKYTAKFPKRAEFFVVSKQIIRSVTSIGANVAEGQSAASKKEFIYFNQVALKSARETIFWFKLLKDLLPLDKEINKLYTECEELTKILSTIVLRAKENQ